MSQYLLLYDDMGSLSAAQHSTKFVRSIIPGVAYAHNDDKVVYNIPPYEAVDLGLSSGILWANKNVNAISPEDSGDYFAWGEVAMKDYYSWDTYKFGTTIPFDKYSTGDEKCNLEPEDDPSTVHMGSLWSTPAPNDFSELINNTTWEYTTLNGVPGFRFTSTANTNSIFIPFVGIFDAGAVIPNAYDYVLWSNECNEGSKYNADGVAFGARERTGGTYSPDAWMNTCNKYLGLPVRGIIRPA